MKRARVLALLLLIGCSRGSYDGEPDAASGGASSGGSAGSPQTLPENVAFQLRPEFDGPCERQPQIDVNLGNEPEAFVRALSCQISGAEPDAATVKSFSDQLRNTSWVRRIDVARSLCAQAARQCAFTYSDPWQAEVELTAACQRSGTRDLGAVLMFWGDCPNGVNCEMDWANTHASGMNARHALFGFGNIQQGYYNPDNPGFWRRELLDARWAGLSFLLLNTFGPDMVFLPELGQALGDIGGGIQVALFDDTWGWGRGDSAPWSSLPSLSDSEGAAQLIYQNKWKPFYSSLASEHWFRVQGKPLIYFYNAGTLQPLDQSSAVIARMKELFFADFGVEPFVAVDRAFFSDGGTQAVADSEFVWNTFSKNEISSYNLTGISHDHFMVKWDAVARDKPGGLATASDRVIKGPELLQQDLDASAAANLAVIATWNDLGEGTGIARNYDYYYQGQWLAPNAFLSIIRQAQCVE
ncbi:MAG TPA: DUF5010 domain-containing protein [Polyangiaceae bacterium]|jgi:hypothetical protein|nr:DUF5010 domain-containing protein [Polyangiaceae bacterium]